MRKILLLLCAIVGALTFTSEAAKKIKINVIPETAKIYIDGQLVGEGTYQVKFEKGVDFYVVKAEAPGYITRTYRLLKSNPKNTVLYVLPEDDAFNSSIGSEDGNDIANRWFEVTCRKDMSEDVVWKRLISVCTNYFDNIEVRDKTAGWIKTQWHTDPLRNTTVRTRLEVRMQFKDEDVLAYSVRISVEKKDNDCRGRDCFKPYDRLLRKYEPLVQELQTSVGGGE